ncbi:MAG: hypothetical protein CM15mV3_2100 [Caudoviricetes sp.]|nr:MAG: hypothetical protein CM15mV3_2100 [Caudoviricetes sp.]
MLLKLGNSIYQVARELRANGFSAHAANQISRLGSPTGELL